MAIKRHKTYRDVEFGDFQTPPELARQVCSLLHDRGVRPASLVEPACGCGNFLFAALDEFKEASSALGVDIAAHHLDALSKQAHQRNDARKLRAIRGNFFELDWGSLLNDLPDPLLIIGNPPWVTNSQLGSLQSDNVPIKSNFQNYSGIEAITGKSNFDISEGMLINILRWTRNRDAILAMLCKTTVARKVLLYAWRHHLPLRQSAIYKVNAAEHFGVAVDACLFICQSSPMPGSFDCKVFDSLQSRVSQMVIGYRDGEAIADINLYEKWKHLRGCEAYRWRSGIKHDCAQIMELVPMGGRYRNGLGEIVDIEDDFVFPLLKSTDLARGNVLQPSRRMIVTQRGMGEDTQEIRRVAPKTWDYLQAHNTRFGNRRSTIYKNRPAYSMFGVGEYSFSPWKVAISGLYRQLDFRVVGSINGKPVVLDDTSYFVACDSEAEARYLASLLNSPIAREFYQAHIFWDGKRPITADLLRRLDLVRLARELGTEATILGYLQTKGNHQNNALTLFEVRPRYITR